MKTKLVTCILSLFIFIVGLCPTVSMAQVPTPPTMGGVVSPEVYNDLFPMPEELPLLASPEAFKADVISRITHGTLNVYGSVASENRGSVIEYGKSSQEILDRLSQIDLKLIVPDVTKEIDFYATLRDDDGWPLAEGYKSTVPVKQLDGSYRVNGSMILELREWQDLEGVTGDIISATLILTEDYTNSMSLPVWENQIQVPMSKLKKKGYLIIVRSEPTADGRYRAVSYGYDLETGKSHALIPLKSTLSFALNNYFEFTDDKQPLFLGGSIVPLNADMRLTKWQTSWGEYYAQSQPVALVTTTVPDRYVAVRIGLFDAQSGALAEYGENLRIKNNVTGEIKDIPVTSGTGLIKLSTPGKYTLMYHLRPFMAKSYSRG